MTWGRRWQAGTGANMGANTGKTMVLRGVRTLVAAAAALLAAPALTAAAADETPAAAAQRADEPDLPVPAEDAAPAPAAGSAAAPAAGRPTGSPSAGMGLSGVGPAAPPATVATPGATAVSSPAGAGAATSGATIPTEIRFRNDLGAGYQVVAAEFLLDGQPVRSVSADGATLAAGAREITAYAGRMTPGAHTLTARVQFQGRRRGPFSYLESYRFRIETAGAFVVPADRGPTGFTMISRERPGLNAPVERRLEMAIERFPAR